ncbi:MAG: SGNH/GDSL hydrolase family protein [Candidatus Omnitrophica bacterium]|nr:SGNH/GDSL hydrolase family protein [Candidatus Omnitrophota bacterium]
MTHNTKDWSRSDIFLNNKITRPSRTLGYEWLPNAKSGWMKTNSLGMLDKERIKFKPDGAYRIICLGDSTTANSDYVKILEGLLNKNKNPEKFEVWNCAVTGYGAIQYSRALEEKWMQYNPDMVIVGFCLNDFVSTPLVTMEQNTLVGYFPHREILPNVSPFLLKHSALYRFAIMRIFFLKNKNYEDYYKDIVEATRHHIQKMRKLCLTSETRFLIVILGITRRFEDCDPYLRRSYAEIKEIITECNIESLDTVPVFQKNDPESLMLSDELHFNRRGNEIVADEIYRYLTQND